MDGRNLRLMRLGDPVDPALLAATTALSGRSKKSLGRLSSIEPSRFARIGSLPGRRTDPAKWITAGYLVSGILGVGVVLGLWFL